MLGSRYRYGKLNSSAFFEELVAFVVQLGCVYFLVGLGVVMNAFMTGRSEGNSQHTKGEGQWCCKIVHFALELY